MAGSFWPLTALSKHMSSLTDELGRSFKPFVVNTTAAVAFLEEKGAIVAEEATKLRKPIAAATAGLQELHTSAKGSQAVASYAAATADRMNVSSAQYEGVLALAEDSATTAPERLALAKQIVRANRVVEAKASPGGRTGNALEAWANEQATATVADWVATLPTGANQDTAVTAYINQSGFGKLAQWGEVASTTLSAIGDFLGTFKDNPGRRLMSILLGVMAGLAVAGVAGLDVYAGVQNDAVTDPLKLVAPTVLGMIFTGVLLGLGSSPTHEVIKVLQSDKERRKLANAPVGGLAVAGADLEARGATLALRYQLPRRVQGEGANGIVLERPAFVRFR